MMRFLVCCSFFLAAFAHADEKAAGKMKVTIKPSDAVTAGAQWQLDSDGIWRNSGTVVKNVSVGTHTVSFKPVSGWKKPKNKVTLVFAGMTSRLSGKYKSTASNEETILLPGNVPLVMKWIPAGTFQMGRTTNEDGSYATEDLQHQVTLSQGYWMAKYEITKAQWQAVMNTIPWDGLAFNSLEPNSPATFISWDNAQAFITALNTYTGLTFKLPTEAQWEYACRAGTATRFYWGADTGYNNTGLYAWYYGNAGVTANDRYAHVVGQKLPNAYGLYDMNGNVEEWCEDWYAASYAADSVSDPTGPATGDGKVIRGGSWYSDGNYCRSAYRKYNYVNNTSSERGFRVVR